MLNQPWRDELEEQRKAEQVRWNTRRESQWADEWVPNPYPDDEEDGFAPVGYAPRQGSVWLTPKSDDWRDGERWSWLTGEAS